MQTIKKDIATEAAVRILNGLIYDMHIPAEEVFGFLKNSRYNTLLDDDNVLIDLMHDNSIPDLITVIGDQINGGLGVSRNGA